MISKEKDYYRDENYTTYNFVKEMLTKREILMQVFAIGHSDDYRLTLNPKLDDSGKLTGVDIKEKETINFFEIIPQGSKFLYHNNETLTKMAEAGKPFSIRDMLHHGMFSLFEDDIVSYELIYENTKNGEKEINIVSKEEGALKDLQINVKQLREKGFVLKNTLMKLKFHIVSFGKTRVDIEEMSYLSHTNNTVEYLEFLTSAENIIGKLSALVNDIEKYSKQIEETKEQSDIDTLTKNQEEVVEIIRKRLEIFKVDTKGLDKTNVMSYISKVPTHYDYEFGDVVNVEGIVNFLGGHFTNDFLYEMDYEMTNIRLEQLVNFINEKLVRIS